MMWPFKRKTRIFDPIPDPEIDETTTAMRIFDPIPDPEIDETTTAMRKWEVKFHDGDSVVVEAARWNTRDDGWTSFMVFSGFNGEGIGRWSTPLLVNNDNIKYIRQIREGEAE